MRLGSRRIPSMPCVYVRFIKKNIEEEAFPYLLTFSYIFIISMEYGRAMCVWMVGK